VTDSKMHSINKYRKKKQSHWIFWNLFIHKKHPNWFTRMNGVLN